VVVVVAKQQECNTKLATLLAALSFAQSEREQALRVRLESVKLMCKASSLPFCFAKSLPACSTTRAAATTTSKQALKF